MPATIQERGYADEVTRGTLLARETNPEVARDALVGMQLCDVASEMQGCAASGNRVACEGSRAAEQVPHCDTLSP